MPGSQAEKATIREIKRVGYSEKSQLWTSYYRLHQQKSLSASWGSCASDAPDTPKVNHYNGRDVCRMWCPDCIPTAPLGPRCLADVHRQVYASWCPQILSSCIPTITSLFLPLHGRIQFLLVSGCYTAIFGPPLHQLPCQAIGSQSRLKSSNDPRDGIVISHILQRPSWPRCNTLWAYSWRRRDCTDIADAVVTTPL